MSVQRLVFINSIGEADIYAVSVKTGDLCIALAPNVRSYLLKRGIIAEDTTRYFTDSSHEKALLKSKEIVSWLRGHVDLPDISTNLVSAYRDMLVFWVRLAAHNYIWIIEIMSNAIVAHEPETICASLSGSVSCRSLSVEPEERCPGSIARAIASCRGLEFEDLAPGKRQAGYFNRLKDDCGLLSGCIVKYARFIIWQLFTVARIRMSGERAILLASPRYQMDKMAAEMQKYILRSRFFVLQSFVIIPVAVPDVAIRLFWPNHARRVIANKVRLRAFENEISRSVDIFKYREVPFAELVAKKMRDSIEDYIVGLMLWSVRLSKAIDAIKPMAILSNGTRADDVLLAEMCKLKNVPDILISHGSHVPPCNEYEKIEWGEHARSLLAGPFSHLALQSPLAEACHKVFPTPGLRLATGPLIWGRQIDRSRGTLLFNKVFGEKFDRSAMKVIIHAGTPRLSKYLRFYVYESSDEYLNAITSLARVVEKIPNMILIIKFRPCDEIGPEDIKALVGLSDRVVLMVDEPFGDVLGMADLLVSFSSTTIEEALQNSVPVLQYGGNGRYQHVSGYEIVRGVPVPPKAVYHLKKVEDLEYAIKSILHKDAEDKAGIFSPYVYPKASRTSLAAVLNTL